MPSRVFEIGKIDIYNFQDDSFLPLFSILKRMSFNSIVHNGWKVAENDSKTVVVKFKIKDNFAAGILFKSSTHINIFALDHVTFSDQAIDQKLTSNEKLVVAMRFYLFNHNPTGSWIAFENVRTPRLDDLNEVVNVFFPDSEVKYFPYVRSKVLKEIKAFKVEWSYATNMHSTNSYKYIEKVQGKISVGRKGNLLNLLINNGKVMIKKGKKEDITEISLNEPDLKMKAFVKKNNIKEEIDIANLITRDIKDYNNHEIQNHEKVIDDLKDFLAQNTPYVIQSE